MDLFGLDLQNFLENKKIYIVQKVDETLKVIFSTSVKSSDLNSFSTFLNLNTTEGNDFFEVLNYNIFELMKESINSSNVNWTKMKALNITEIRNNVTYTPPSYYTKDEKSYISFTLDYLHLQENYNKYIYTNISVGIKTLTNEQITSDKLTPLRLDNSYIFSNSSSQILLTKTPLEIFTLPIPLGFDYINDYNIIITNKTKFYFIFVQNPDSNQMIDSFFMNIVYSMIFSFISVCFLNFIIWVVIGSCYYFYFKAILSPLKKINEDFKELVFIKEKNIDNNNSNFKAKKPVGEETTGFILTLEKKLLRFLQKNTIDLTEYREIYDAFMTIKVLRTIRQYKLVSSKNKKLNKIKNREEHMEGIMKALLYLMYGLRDIIIEDIHFDSRLIANLISHNFMFKIATNESEKNITFFYEYFTSLIDKTIENSEKNFSKAKKFEVLKKIGVKRHKNIDDYYDEKFISINNGNKNLKEVYISLKEDIQYSYCIYKLRNIEKSRKKDYIDNFICYSSSSSSDDDHSEVNQSIEESKVLTEEQAINDRRDYLKSGKHKKKNVITNLDEEQLITIDSDSMDDNRISIKALINDFLKYFSISNSNEISVNTLKHISVHIILANLYYELNKECECLKQCTIAMEKIKNLQEKIYKLGNLTKFSFLSICVLFYEKMFYIFSNLSENFDQKKTQFFIYLKLLDLGPIYDSRIRINVFQNIMDFMHKKELSYIRYDIAKEEKLINSKIIRHKIRAMMNMTKRVAKNVTYCIDVHCPILTQNDFKYMFEKMTLDGNTSINFVLFNENLIFNENGMHHDYNFLFSNEQKNYDNKTSALDKAILECLENFKYNDFPKNNNYLFVLTDIDSSFDHSINNISKITLKIFKERYSLIILLFWDDKIYNSAELKKKLYQLRKWLENNTNGVMIIVKNYTVIKHLINCVHPVKFKEFDPIVLKNMVTSIDLNLHLENILSKKVIKSSNIVNTINSIDSDIEVKKYIKENDNQNDDIIYFSV